VYRIALCDDEKLSSETQEQICRDILEKLHIEYSIDVFESGEDFFAAFSKGGQRFDLILLDIVMGDMNGMELAGKIREFDQETEIIFITSSSEYVMQGYDVGALHYLIKPVNADKLEDLIAKIYKDKFQDNYFVLKTGSQSQRIPIKSIVSLETVGRKVEITLTDRTLRYSGKLTELLDELPIGSFIRCHQAFAVNIKKIRELNRSGAIAVNGKVIPISRPYMKNVQTAFLMNMQDI
jgi:DNA-binding LytR/AlgR family response regulator